MAIFSFLTIMKTAIRNTFLHVPCTFFTVTYRYPLRSGNAGFQGSWMCNFIQLSRIAFPKRLYWFTFPAAIFQRYYRSTFSSILSVVQLLFFWLDWCTMSTRCAQICIFLINKETAKPLCAYWPHAFLFLFSEKGLFMSFAQFHPGLFPISLATSKVF